MQAVDREKKRFNPLVATSLAVFLLILVLVVFKIGGPVKHSYDFVSSDHPVEMWEDGTSRWSYFFLEKQKPIEVLATDARSELLPLGFTEDSTQRPWYRFVNGSKEVVLCYHNEFAINQTKTGTKLIKRPHPTGILPDSGKWSCVLVKNGLGTETSIPLFAVKKLIRGW